MIARLEPVISEMEREGESIVIVGHQAVLRVIFGYLMAQVCCTLDICVGSYIITKQEDLLQGV